MGCHVSRGCLYHSLGNPNHHVFQHFLADDTGGCLTPPFMAFATSRLGRKTHKAFGESQAAFSELNNKVQESVSGIKVTKSFGYQEAELQSFQETNKMTFKKNMHTMKYDSLFDPLVLLFVGSSYVLTLLVGAFMIQAGQITVGNLVTFITYLDMLVWPLMAIGFPL